MARLKSDERKDKILNAAINLAEKEGITKIKRADIAALAECTSSLVAHYFPTVAELRAAIMCAAITRENLNILAQGMVSGNLIAKRASSDLKRRAAESII